MVVMGSGDEIAMRFARRRASGSARRVEARLPAAGGRLGQGRGRQHRVFAVRVAASFPWNEQLSLSPRRTLSARCRTCRVPARLSDSSGSAADPASRRQAGDIEDEAATKGRRSDCEAVGRDGILRAVGNRPREADWQSAAGYQPAPPPNTHRAQIAVSDGGKILGHAAGPLFKTDRPGAGRPHCQQPHIWRCFRGPRCSIWGTWRCTRRWAVCLMAGCALAWRRHPRACTAILLAGLPALYLGLRRKHARPSLGAMGARAAGDCGGDLRWRAPAEERTADGNRGFDARPASMERGGYGDLPRGDRRFVVSQRAAGRDREDYQSRQPAAIDGPGRRGLAFSICAVFRANHGRAHHPFEFLHGQPRLRGVPQGYLRAMEKLDAPFRVVQQPVLPEGHRVHAGRDRHAAQQVVRRMPRSRGLLQRTVRPAHQGTDRYARSAGRPGLHVLPRHRARGQHHGQRGFHGGVSAAARARRQPQPGAPRGRLRPDVSQSGAAPAHVPEAVHARPRILRRVPQSAPGRPGQRLPLDSRIQRLRQLAGQRRIRAGRAFVLLPRQISDLRGLPHAAGCVARSRQSQRPGSFAPLRRSQYGRGVRATRTRRR